MRKRAMTDFLAEQVKAEADQSPAPTDYRTSVFARRRLAGQSQEEFVNGLADHALAYLKGARYLGFLLESELGEDFPLIPTEEPPDHYDIVLGDDVENLRVEELSALFSTHERVKVAR